MRIQLQVLNLWKDLSERIDILSFEYDYIMNYNVRKGFYLGIIVMNIDFLIYVLNKDK